MSDELTIEDNKGLSYEALVNICKENSEYFENDQTDKGQRLHAAFLIWVDHIEKAKILRTQINQFAFKYDFNETSPGNGYRSFVSVTDACIKYSLEMCSKLNLNKSKIFFRKKFYVKEVESCCQLLISICTCLNYLIILREWTTDDDNLFAGDDHTAEELFQKGETINQYAFYGRCLGFQYGESVRGVLRFISVGMAGFSESYYSNNNSLSKTTRSIWTSGKYYFNPELRSRRIVNISQNSDVDFCKSFWFLTETELMHKLPSVIGSFIQVNKVIVIPPESINIISLNGDFKKEINIPIPESHIGPGEVFARLLSNKIREGMIGEGSRWKKQNQPSDSLLFHCHGGGFVAQSSKSHELYLRSWAIELDIPILSIDYSLAPEAPFPRAIEEVFYAYCWAIKNAKCLGWTGEKIILCGDSAGANLCVGIVLKCIELGVRKPNGLFLAYCPVLVSFVPSPARMLCLMDPLLPFGFMMRCLKAYASPSKNLTEVKKPTLPSDKFCQETYSLKNQMKTVNSKHDASSSLNTNDYSELVENFNDKDSFESEIQINDATACIDTPSKEEFLNSFLKKYVVNEDFGTMDSKMSNNPMTNSEDNLFIETGKDVLSQTAIKEKLNNIVTHVSSTINEFVSSSKINKDNTEIAQKNLQHLDALIARSPSDEFRFDVPKDPYLSPYWASDEHLKKFPPTKILTVDMDPCLDDCVMFAKKLKYLGAPVDLKILNGLPHGFLNLTMVSDEALQGSKKCVHQILELLKM